MIKIKQSYFPKISTSGKIICKFDILLRICQDNVRTYAVQSKQVIFKRGIKASNYVTNRYVIYSNLFVYHI